MKTVVIKCNLSEADFIVSNIIPVEKSTRDLEVIIPVEIDDSTSDPFKFLTERKDIVLEWKFLEELEEEVKQEIQTKEILPEVDDIELKDEDTENTNREINAGTYILNSPFELDKFIVVFCKIYLSNPALRPFTKHWDMKFREMYGENKFSYGEENLRKCAEILKIWDRERYPLSKIGTEMKKWLLEVGREEGSKGDLIGYIIDKLLTYLTK